MKSHVERLRLHHVGLWFGAIFRVIEWQMSGPQTMNCNQLNWQIKRKFRIFKAGNKFVSGHCVSRRKIFYYKWSISQNFTKQRPIRPCLKTKMSQIEEIACKFVFVELSLKILSRNFVSFKGGNKFVSGQCVPRRKIFYKWRISRNFTKQRPILPCSKIALFSDF